MAPGARRSHPPAARASPRRPDPCATSGHGTASPRSSDQEALEGGTAYKDRIVALGLRYGLLTDHTSFIAVDRVVRNPNPALAATVDQPLPLPAGVSELAVGGAELGAEVPGTPEPAFWIALLVTLGIVGVGAARVARQP
jgi:Ca-activated chloride channel family protein